MVGGHQRPPEVDLVSVRVASGGDGTRAGSAVAEPGSAVRPRGRSRCIPWAVGLLEPGRPVPPGAATAAGSALLREGCLLPAGCVRLGSFYSVRGAFPRV